MLQDSTLNSILSGLLLSRPQFQNESGRATVADRPVCGALRTDSDLGGLR